MKNSDIDKNFSHIYLLVCLQRYGDCGRETRRRYFAGSLQFSQPSLKRNLLKRKSRTR